MLVQNSDGTATLSATLTNHLGRAVEINGATGGGADDLDAPAMMLFSARDAVLTPARPVRIGGTTDAYRARLRDRVAVGSTVPITIRLQGHDTYDPDIDEVSFLAPVVRRTTARAWVADNSPNKAISVRSGTIVVVPGQEKAYLDGWIDSTVDDMTDIRPTGQLPSRGKLDVLHQTATGGPSGFFAQAGEPTRLGYGPYLDDDPPGDRDYVRASEVEIGQTVRIRFRFPSGDVVGRFRVVQARLDGTV